MQFSALFVQSFQSLVIVLMMVILIFRISQFLASKQALSRGGKIGKVTGPRFGGVSRDFLLGIWWPRSQCY